MLATKYVVFLADESTIEHHGKAETKSYQLCFSCATKMAMNNHQIFPEIIETAEEMIYCDHCSGDLPEGVF